jgi:hypothetical protein
MILRPTDDADYFHVRAIEEQTAAQRATSAAARGRHDELAMMFRFREHLVRTIPPEFPEEPVNEMPPPRCAA